MKKLFSIFVKIFIALLLSGMLFFVQNNAAYANDNPTEISKWEITKANKFILGSEAMPEETIAVKVDNTNPLVGFLTIIQKVLLKLILPVVAVGCGLYIAYELFTADGDDSKMSQAWKAILYSVVAIISIGLSALIVGIIAWLNIG